MVIPLIAMILRILSVFKRLLKRHDLRAQSLFALRALGLLQNCPLIKRGKLCRGLLRLLTREFPRLLLCRFLIPLLRTLGLVAHSFRVGKPPLGLL